MTLAFGGTKMTRSCAPASELTSNSLCPCKESSLSRGREMRGLRFLDPSGNNPRAMVSSDVSDASGAKLVSCGQSKNSMVVSPCHWSMPSRQGDSKIANGSHVVTVSN